MFLSSSSTSSADEGEATASKSQDSEYKTGTQVCLKPKPAPFSVDLRRKVKNATKKEESLFSLKQFLKNDSHSNHQYTGTKPKVYEPQLKRSELNENNETGKYSRNPTELPDFVQDHLVIEQCYLGEKSSTNIGNIEVENLPDFALNSVAKRHARNHNGERHKVSEDTADITFDLTDHLHKDSVISSSHQHCSDLSNLNNVINGKSTNVIESLGKGFPFKLQIPRDTESNSSNIVTDPLQSEIHNTTKLLPDFLSDASVRSRGNSLLDGPNCSNTSNSVNHKLILENERLRKDLQNAKRQANEHLIRIQALENELLSRKQSDHTENANIEKAMQQVEDNLKHNTKRAINAENRIASLKEDVESLSLEIKTLRTENRKLKMTMEMNDTGYRTLNSDHRIQGLADSLRLAASTAEVSLKQLISGVNNLKVLASTLEKKDETQDNIKDFFSDFDENNASGSAL